MGMNSSRVLLVSSISTYGQNISSIGLSLKKLERNIYFVFSRASHPLSN
jgi:hypothetical protein